MIPRSVLAPPILFLVCILAGPAAGGQTSAQPPASLKLEVAATPFIAREGNGFKQRLRTEWAEGTPVEVKNGETVVPLPAFGIRTLRIIHNL